MAAQLLLHNPNRSNPSSIHLDSRIIYRYYYVVEIEEISTTEGKAGRQRKSRQEGSGRCAGGEAQVCKPRNRELNQEPR